MNRYYLFFVFIIMGLNSILAQKEDYNWVLNNNIRVNFNQQPPLVALDIPLLTGAAVNSTSISNSNGDLLFYISGLRIYNYNHQLIYTTQPAVLYNQVNVVPHSTESNKYYWIVPILGTPTTKRLDLYIIDMLANGDLGAVNTIDTIEYSNYIIARQASSNNYWLVCIFLDRIVEYQITPTGFGVGISYNIAIGEDVSYCKVSPDMSKFYLGTVNSLYVIDFNCQTGSIANLHKILNNPGAFEFSRNGEFVYIVKQNPTSFELIISQFSTNASVNETDFTNSEKILYQQTLNVQYLFRDMQLAPDNKIYFTMSDYYLWAIENPDLPAPLSTVNDKALWLNGNKSGSYLPNYFYYYPTFGYINSCSSTSFYYSGVSAINLLWNFGDGQTSAELNPNHSYSSSGTYTVSLKATYTGGQEQTVTKQIVISQKPTATTITHN